jgi:hypothetical protein
MVRCVTAAVAVNTLVPMVRRVGEESAVTGGAESSSAPDRFRESSAGVVGRGKARRTS